MVFPAYTPLKGEMYMLGRVEFTPGGRGRGELSDLYGLTILSARADPEGFWGSHRLYRAGQTLRRGGVRRALLPKTFTQWTVLEKLGLRPVEPEPLLKECSPELAVEALRGRNVDPGRATVALSGTRTDGEMLRCAVRMCTSVRSLVIDAPQGQRLAHCLREEFGLPVLPADHPAHLAVRFQPCGGRTGEPFLELYGRTPELDGMRLSVPELGEEERDALDVLCVLWQRGRLEPSRIKIHRN